MTSTWARLHQGALDDAPFAERNFDAASMIEVHHAQRARLAGSRARSRLARVHRRDLLGWRRSVTACVEPAARAAGARAELAIDAVNRFSDVARLGDTLEVTATRR